MGDRGETLPMDERVKRWTLKYGPVPEGATHIKHGTGAWKTDVVKMDERLIYLHVGGDWVAKGRKDEGVDYDLLPNEKSQLIEESKMNVIEKQLRKAVESIVGWVAFVVIIVVASVLLTGFISAFKTGIDYGVRGAAAPIVDAGSAVWYGRKGADAELPQECSRQGDVIECDGETYKVE